MAKETGNPLPVSDCLTHLLEQDAPHCQYVGSDLEKCRTKKSTAGSKEQKSFYVSVVRAERRKCHQKFLPHFSERKVD